MGEMLLDKYRKHTLKNSCFSFCVNSFVAWPVSNTFSWLLKLALATILISRPMLECSNDILTLSPIDSKATMPSFIQLKLLSQSSLAFGDCSDAVKVLIVILLKQVVTHYVDRHFFIIQFSSHL